MNSRDMEKRLRISTLALTGFCILTAQCGVCYSVLVGNLVSFIVVRVTQSGSSAGILSLLWPWGFVYLIPAFLGVIAIGLRKRGAYIAHIVASLAVVGIVIYLIASGSLSTAVQSSSRGFCSEMAAACTCETQSMQNLLEYFTCKEVNRLVRMGIGVDAMFYGGFVLIIISAFTSGLALQQVTRIEKLTKAEGMSSEIGQTRPVYATGSSAGDAGLVRL